MLPSLLEALTNGFDLSGPPKFAGDFVKKLQEHKNKAVTDYLKYGIDLNTSIADIAGKNNLNDDQIQRIIEESNTQVYLIKYNEMKASPERDVVFNLASLNGVKEKLGTSASKTLPPKDQGTGEGESVAEKVASWENGGDQVTFMNYSPYEFKSLAADKERELTHIELEKMARAIQTVSVGIDREIQKTSGLMYDIAGALIKYDRHGLSVPEIFGEIVKKASFSSTEKVILKKAVDQRIEQMKELRQLPKGYSLDLKHDEFLKEALKKEEFSLKSHSFKEDADFKTPSNQSVVPVVVDRKVVRSVQDLVNMANEATAAKEEAMHLMEEKKDLVKQSGLSEELVEKITSDPLSVNAVKFFFGKKK